MAERRMFAKSIIDSDAFLELPARCQLLYFHLGMRADDDGFVNKPKSILRMAGCSEEDLKKLLDEKYLIAFDSGIMVIRHWNLHNRIRKDSYKETIYKNEKSLLEEGENRVYSFVGTNPSQGCNEVVTGTLRQDRLGKESLGKARSGQESIGGCGGNQLPASFRPPSLTEVMIYVKQKKYQVDPERFLQFYLKNGWKEQGKPMKDWKEAVDLWQQRKW